MSVILEWNDEQDVWPIPETVIDLLQKLLVKAAEREQIAAGEVALTFVDDARIHELNLEYRGIDRPTDVLSFSMLEGEDADAEWMQEEETPLLGDIVISVPKAIEQAESYGHSVERELGFLFVHGFLHLIGYDHQTEEEEQEMFGIQEAILADAGLMRS